MKRTCCLGITTGLVLVMLVFLCGRSTGETLAEFGPSVQFDELGSGLQVASLRGKAVLIIFFQSWCGICNGWSPELIKQVEAAHANDRRLVLIAIKTDGGGLAAARSYMKSKGANLDAWVIGSDKEARYYKQVTGQDGLWKFVLAGADGEIVQAGNAGGFWKREGGKMEFALSSKDLVARCGAVATFLPADKKYPESLAQVTRVAEMGNFVKALRLCSAKTSGRDKEAAIALAKDIEAVVTAKIKAAADTLKDAAKDWGTRYEAYKTLGVLLNDFGKTAVGREATPVFVEMGRNENIRKEGAAESYYSRAMARLAPNASRSDALAVAKELAAIAKKFGDTKYGKRAEAEAKRIVEEKKDAKSEKTGR